jgi:hypothetical protein
MTSPDLNFTVEGAEPLRFAASPHIVFKLRVKNDSPFAVHTVILRCQINIDASRRRYSTDEQSRLTDLFGQPSQWAETLRGLLWTNTSTVLPAFQTDLAADLPVPCTFDFNIAATKYFEGLQAGDVPISFYFNGTIFYSAESGALQVAQISWEKEASYRMPISVWKQMMDLHYPNVAWLCLQRHAFDRLYEFKVRNGIPTFEEAVFQTLEGEMKA